jgi:hypothetical protein
MRRWGKLIAFAVVVLLIGLIPLALAWGHVPDPIASHWGLSGSPDGHLPRSAQPLLMVGLILVALLTTSLFRVEGEPTAEAFGMVGLMGGLGVALNGLVAHLNWDVPTWEAARAFQLWHIGVVLVGAFAGGPIGFVLGRRWYPTRTASAADGPVIDVGPGERVAWVGRAAVRWPLFLLIGAVVTYIAIPGWGIWLAGLFVLLALGMMQVEANVGNDGLVVRLGGIPVRRISLDRVSSARAIDLEPAEWGGWGWRASPNGTAIVLRRGDALELTFLGGRRFAVTVDDAATGAALLNGLVARRLGDR